MKILIDFLAQLTPEFNDYRSNLTSELSRILGLEVYLAVPNKKSVKLQGNYKSLAFSKKYHWDKESPQIKSIKPDALILFTQPGKEVMRKYPVFIFLEAIEQGDLFALKESKLRSTLEKLKDATGLIVRTKYLQVYLSNHFNLEKNNIYSIGQGIEERFFKSNITEDVRAVRRVLSMYRISKPYIYISGKLTESPNIDKALEVFANVHQKYPDLKLLVESVDFSVGWDNRARGLNKQAIEILELCEKQRISRKVVFAGSIDREHLPIILSNALLIMHLEERKDFSKTLTEALAAGAPIIVNDSPVLKEIAGNAAVITTSKVSKEAVNAVQFLLENEKERIKFGEKAVFRSESYTWEMTAKRLFEYISIKNKSKTKEKMVFLDTQNEIDSFLSKYPGTLNAFNKVFDVSNAYIYKYTISFRKFTKLVSMFKNKDYVVVHENSNLSTAVNLILLRIFVRKRYWIAIFDSDCDRTVKGGFGRRFIKNVKYRILGRYLSLFYKNILVPNPFCINQFEKILKINNKKLQYLPNVFSVKLNKSKSVELRNKAKLKNYLCIAARVDNIRDWKKLYKIVNSLYEEFQEFKVLVIKDPFIDFENSGGKKIQKRFLFFTENEIQEVLLNSKIYFDFRDSIKQDDILMAMKARNCCILKRSLPAMFLVKPGINGYVYSYLETDKIQKQIEILFKNKPHLNDIRKVNAFKIDLFSNEYVLGALTKLYQSWR